VRRGLVVLALASLLAACGGQETVSPLPETVEGTTPQAGTTTGEAPPEGDPEAGRAVFDAQGCAACHTFEAAGAEGMTGPNLDESLQGADAQFIHESIVNPDAEIAEGFQPGLMPKDYGDKLSEQELADLVAFLQPQS
jgi:cytochrome c oxidase subunit II